MSDKTSDVKEPLASFKQRAMAGLVPDYLVPILLTVCGSIVLAFASDALMIVAGVVSHLASLLTFIGIFIFRPYKFKGQTMGKTRQHITTKKIVNNETWELADLGEGDIGLIIGRAIVGWIEVLFPIPIIISYLMINSSNNNQRLSDRLFGTVVVQIDPADYEVKKKDEQEKIAEDTHAKTTEDKATTTTQIDSGETNNLALISKFVLIGGFVLPIITFFLNFLHSLLVTISFSINVWGGFWPFTGLLFRIAINSFDVVSYICFFIIIGAIILLAFQYTNGIRTNLLVSGGLFGVFTILWIIAYKVNWGFVPFAIFGTGDVSISVGQTIFWFLAVTAFCVSLFFFNKYIHKANEEHEQEIPKFKGLIQLIMFSALQFIVFLIGVIAIPTDAFGATIYYLLKFFGWCFSITMMIVCIGFIFKAIKFDAKKIPAKN